MLYGERGLHAIEVKHADRIRPADLAGLEAFCADYPEAKATLLYMGERAEQHGLVKVLPIAGALPRLAELLA